MLNPEHLRTRFVPESEMERILAAHPKMKRSPELYCPTCNKTGTYFWNGAEQPCDCELQLQLHKHYLAAGIGVTYQRLSWADYHGDPTVSEMIQPYLANHASYVGRGMGLLFTGDVGRGKTLAATLVLKDLMQLGYRCYSTTFANMVEMFTAGWYAKDEKDYFQRKIRSVEVLLLDDLGREFRNRNKLSETTFDDVLRARAQAGRPTLITTNMDVAELMEGYGSGALSLLSESSLVHKFKGTDFRPQANERLRDEVAEGIVRPIF